MRLPRGDSTTTLRFFESLSKAGRAARLRCGMLIARQFMCRLSSASEAKEILLAHRKNFRLFWNFGKSERINRLYGCFYHRKRHILCVPDDESKKRDRRATICALPQKSK